MSGESYGTEWSDLSILAKATVITAACILAALPIRQIWLVVYAACAATWRFVASLFWWVNYKPHLPFDEPLPEGGKKKAAKQQAPKDGKGSGKGGGKQKNKKSQKRGNNPDGRRDSESAEQGEAQNAGDGLTQNKKSQKRSIKSGGPQDAESPEEAGHAGDAAGSKPSQGVSLKTLMKGASRKHGGAGHKPGGDERVAGHPCFVATLKGHSAAATGVAVSPDGRVLASVGEDCHVRVYTLTSTGRNCACQVIPTRHSLVDVAFGAGGDPLVVSSKGLADRAEMLFFNKDRSIGRYLPEPALALPDFHDKDTAIKLVSATQPQSGRTLFVSCSKATDVRVFSSKGDVVAVLQPNALANNSVAISRDARFVSAAAFAPDAHVWEALTERGSGELKKVAKAMDIVGHNRLIQSVAISPDSRRAVTASQDRTLRVWNIDVRYHQNESIKLVAKQQLPGKVCYANMVYCTADVIAAIAGTALYFLDAATGEVLTEIREAHDTRVADVAAADVAAGTAGDELPRVATVGVDGRVRLWRLPGSE